MLELADEVNILASKSTLSTRLESLKIPSDLNALVFNLILSQFSSKDEICKCTACYGQFSFNQQNWFQSSHIDVKAESPNK